MTTTTGTSPYEACDALFRDYPSAVEVIAPDRVTSMTLMLPGTKTFFSLTGQVDEDGAFYHLNRRGSDGEAEIEADGRMTGDAALSVQVARDVISTALPLPRNGSLFGWAPAGEVTALVAFYDDGGPNGEPVISTMPHADLPKTGWPPFAAIPAGAVAAGPWIWGPGMVDAGGQIAGTTGRVFWVPTEGAQSAGCIGVTGYLDLPSGQRLLSGLYVYSGDLEAGMPLPDWPVTTDGTIDLGPRFRTEA